MNKNLPGPKYSFWPILLAFAIALIAVGVVSNYAISVVGLALLFAAVTGWTWENRTEGLEDDNE